MQFFLTNKPNALVVDFFAGSGTTLHAVNLLNAEDGGNRRCIIVTNNEVSADEAKSLSDSGYHPGDEEWEKLGIARYVTWPRTVCSIEGHDVKGNPLKGNYLGSDKPMADGFKANAAFFKLGFLDKTSVALGRQFKEMLPTLWMKAGAIGKCPTVSEDIPDMLILPENKFAVLIDEMSYMTFEKQIAEHSEIKTIYIVTDSEPGYREMIAAFEGKNTYQLYRDYLDNFRINTGR
jgi:adenine-specific DNA-methyltransferase